MFLLLNWQLFSYKKKTKKYAYAKIQRRESPLKKRVKLFVVIFQAQLFPFSEAGLDQSPQGE